MNVLGVKEFERGKLEEELDRVIKKPLIMVIAPSGYGKSTLVRQYFAKNDSLLNLWFPMQRDEVDGNWIWHRICNKIHEYNEPLYDRVAQLNLPQSAQEMSYMMRMLNTYVVREEYLIIDDYQECNSPWLHSLLENIAVNVPHFHIVLISRTYPELAYEELFLKGYCAIINQQNLTLDIDETREIFRLNGAELNDRELDELYEYTDGWISAVYLSLYEYKKRGSFGSFFGVNHLLKTAIFDKLSPFMQEFFMRVSLFDWFELEGARYVTQMDIAENSLFESMEQFGFLHYDTRSRSFQMHALLRTVAELELKKSDIDMQGLYSRAAQWCEKKGSFIEAVKYYKKAQNSRRIAQIYSGEHGKNLIEQAPELFEDVRDFIWEDIWNDNLMAWLNYVYFCMMSNGTAQTLPMYEELVRQVGESERWSSDEKIRAELLVLKSITEFNDLKAMNASLMEAAKLLGYRTSQVLGNSLLTYGTICMTLLYYNRSGGLKQTIEQEKIYARHYMTLTKGVQEGWDEFFDAEYALMRGEFGRAYELAERAYKKTALRHQSCVVISCYYIMLRCLLYLGEKGQFYEKLEEMKKSFTDVVDPVLIIDVELVQGYMYACLGMREKMPEWLADFRLENCNRAIRNIRSGCMTYGRLLCSEKNWEHLDIVGDEMLVPYANTVHLFPIIVGYIYKAIAKFNMGQSELAVEYLKKAVDCAREDGIVIPFIENGHELAPILRVARSVQRGETLGELSNVACGEMRDEVHDEVRGGETDAFLEGILAQAEKYERGRRLVAGEAEADDTAGDDSGAKAAAVPLTKREAELMEYVRAGLRNAEIGEKMHIAQVTVEKNLTSIYRKLGVKNRTAAIRMLDDMYGSEK